MEPLHIFTALDDSFSKQAIDDYFKEGKAHGKHLVIELDEKRHSCIALRKLAWHENLRQKFNLLDKILTKLGFESRTDLKKIVHVCKEKGIINPNFASVIASYEKVYPKAIPTEEKEQVIGYFSKGIKLYEEKEFVEAEKCFRKAIRINPKNQDANFHLGLCLLKQKNTLENFLEYNPENAVHCFREVIRYNPDNSEAHASLSTVLRDVAESKGSEKSDRYFKALTEKNYDAAEQIMREAIEIDPNDDLAHYILGNILYKQGRHSDAELSWRRAIRLDPFNPKAHACLASVQPHNDSIKSGKLSEALISLREGELNNAEKIARQVIRSHPKDSLAYLILGAIMCEQENPDYPQIQKILEEANRLDPENYHVHTFLGAALKGQGRLEEAIESYRKAIEIDPNPYKARIGLGIILGNQYTRWNPQKYKDAAVNFMKAIEIDPHNPIAYNNLGFILLKQGHYLSAEVHLSRAVAQDPNYYAAYVNLGAALKGQGRLEKAIEIYKKAIEMDPHDPITYNNLGFILLQQGKYQEAEASFRTAIGIDPKNSEVYTNLGAALKGQGRLEEAIESYKKAIEIDPKNSNAHKNLGLILMEQGKYEEAKKSLTRATAINPKDYEAVYNLGLSLYKLGRYEEAEASFREATEINPQEYKAHHNLGLTLMNQDKFDEARRSLREALKLSNDPTVLESCSILDRKIKFLKKI